MSERKPRTEKPEPEVLIDFTAVMKLPEDKDGRATYQVTVE